MRNRARLVALSSLALLGLAACNGRGDDCVSTRDYFVNEVWGPVMSQSCISCHAPDGQAALVNAEFVLLPSAYPGFLDANFDNIKALSANQYNGVPLLLAKPLGLTEHGGGKLFDEDSDQYRRIKDLLDQLQEPVECPAGGEADDFSQVTQLDPPDTLRKASLHLVGRLPTEQELARVDEGGDDELALVLRELLAEDAFYDRLSLLFNDLYLTDRYLRYTGFAVALLNDDDVPRAGAWYNAQDDQRKQLINAAVAREPLDLINHVVREERPFTEILTADYTVLSPYSAELYDLSLGFSDPSDPRELKEAKLSAVVDGAQVPYPHAGVLTSPMFLNRFPTTPTNRNRHRARNVFKLFLATDILRIAERPIDPAAATKYNNPQRDDPSCSVCHKMIDPIAGAFQKFSDYDQAELIPDREWYPEMYSPGFGNEIMPSDQFDVAPQWLASRVVDDPRFALAAVYAVFSGLTGQQPLTYPADDATDFAPRLAAWQAQDAVLSRIVDDFVADDFNLKTAIVGVLMSPYFRGANASGELSADDTIRLAGVGGGRLSTPELLARKIEAVTGVRWVRGWDLAEYMLTDFRILYGGIDSDTITTRLTQMSGLMGNVASRLANEVACAVTAYEFTLPADQRRLLPHVTLDHLPDGASGDPVPAAIDKIKLNIQHLHRRVLGEELALDSPEIERTYALFYDLWKQGRADLASGVEGEWMEWQCAGRVDPNTQVELPESQQIFTDPNYTIRAWMGVLIYLFSDYKFLYE
jgi:hypothetical protein